MIVVVEQRRSPFILYICMYMSWSSNCPYSHLHCHNSWASTVIRLIWEDICSDLGHHLGCMGQTNISPNNIYNYSLFLIDKALKMSGSSLQAFHQMLQPIHPSPWDSHLDNNLIAKQLNYDHKFDWESAAQRMESLNAEQTRAFWQAIWSVEENLGHTFFLDGPGGMEKTYVYISLCHYLWGQGKIVICMASSDIAALLLPGGQTAHSMFKIPINGLNNESFCNIPKDSQRAKLLQDVDLFIWDEALMQHHNAAEALDHSLHDICNCNQPFGRKTMIFGGNFQQMLPMVPKGTQEDIIATSLPKSYLWHHIKVLRLCQNMQLEHASTDKNDFAKWLLDIWHGHGIADDGTISLHENMACSNVDSLIDYVYLQISGPMSPPQYFLDHIILATRNSDVSELNNSILDCFQGARTTLHSSDQVVTEKGADPVDDAIPIEYLHSLKATGLLPGNLHVKIGCPLILLHNLAPSCGLCNGTWMVLLQISHWVLQVQIMGGDFDGNIELIPHISLTLSSSCTKFAFSLHCQQFPVRLAFAISINKAQGQPVKTVGLDLWVPVFSHGQLYVALSCATSSSCIKALLSVRATGLRTTNVVYPEIFRMSDPDIDTL